MNDLFAELVKKKYELRIHYPHHDLVAFRLSFDGHHVQHEMHTQDVDLFKDLEGGLIVIIKDLMQELEHYMEAIKRG